MIVVDVNVIAYLLIQGTRTAEAQAVWRADDDWAVPDLWRDEFLNILTTYVRRGGTDLESAKRLWTTAAQMFTPREHRAAPSQVLDLAHRYRLSAYDAQYLAVAVELGVQLVTEDRALNQSDRRHTTTMRAFIEAH